MTDIHDKYCLTDDGESWECPACGRVRNEADYDTEDNVYRCSACGQLLGPTTEADDEY